MDLSQLRLPIAIAFTCEYWKLIRVRDLGKQHHAVTTDY